MKVREWHAKGMISTIEPVTNKALFWHFFRDGVVRATEANWEYIKMMCEAHNEPLEKVAPRGSDQ